SSPAPPPRWPEPRTELSTRPGRSRPARRGDRNSPAARHHDEFTDSISEPRSPSTPVGSSNRDWSGDDIFRHGGEPGEIPDGVFPTASPPGTLEPRPAGKDVSGEARLPPDPSGRTQRSAMARNSKTRTKRKA